MFKLDQGKTKLEFWFQGYEAPEHRYHGDDDSWAGFHAEVSTKHFSFESHGTDIESSSVDHLKDMLEKFLNNQMPKEEYYSPIEEGFNIRFFPKGTEYGYIYDSKNNLIEKKEIELSIAIPDEDWISDFAFVKFKLDEEETKQFYDYICNVINNEH
jgi:hypothetical protein